MHENNTLAVTSFIERVVEEIPGWSPPDQLLVLFTLANSLQNLAGDIVEIGSWCGRSAVVLGKAAKNINDTAVHCIDLFPEKSDWFENADGTFSFSVKIGNSEFGAYQEQTVWAEPYFNDVLPVYSEHESLLERFRTTLSSFELTQNVRPFRGDLELFLASQEEGFKCKLAFIDGDHGYKAVTHDISLIDSILSKGGWICFDDAFTSYEGVDRAIRDSIINNPRYGAAHQLTRKMFAVQKRANK